MLANLMIDMNIDATKLKDLIRTIAKEELLPRFTKVSHSHKADGSIVTEADIAAQQQITTTLKQHWPDFVLLGEEMTTDQQAQILASDQPVWCLDPLDGTSNFAAGIPYFAVSLSLIYHSEVILGLVYDPIRDECFFANKMPDNTIKGSFNDTALTPIRSDIKLANATAIVDFKRLTDTLATRIVTERPFSSQRNFGASALDWCWLAVGRGHVYLHGNQNLWDYTAGELIFRAAGGLALTLEGETIYEKAIKKRSVVAAINQSLFDEWRHWINS